MSAAAELVSTVPVRRALRALGAAPATWYRHRTPQPPHPPARQRVPPLALSEPQRQRIVEVLTSPRFAGVTPYTAWARLLDEDGLHLASVRTFYGVLAAEELVQEGRISSCTRCTSGPSCKLPGRTRCELGTLRCARR
jgi:hypothetical protein